MFSMKLQLYSNQKDIRLYIEYSLHFIDNSIIEKVEKVDTLKKYISCTHRI